MVETQSIGCYISEIAVRYSLISQTYSWWELHWDLEFEKSNTANESMMCTVQRVGPGITELWVWVSDQPIMGEALWGSASRYFKWGCFFLPCLIYSIVWKMRGCCLTSFLKRYCFLWITWNIHWVITLKPLKCSQNNNRKIWRTLNKPARTSSNSKD